MKFEGKITDNQIRVDGQRFSKEALIDLKRQLDEKGMQAKLEKDNVTGITSLQISGNMEQVS